MTHLVLLSLFWGSAVLAQNPNAPGVAQSLSELPETYVVQPGDTCMDIAKKFYGSASEYPRLHVFNDMGPLPHNHKPGAIVRLRFASPDDAQRKTRGKAQGTAQEKTQGSPRVTRQDAPQDITKEIARKSDAVLTAFSATVNTRGAKMSEWKSAEVNQHLFRLDEVHTLSNASADILFEDHSALQMKQNALIIIYGGSSSKVRLRKAGGVELVQGELGVSLADLRKPPVSIVTPSVEISARTQEAIVDVDKNQTTRISVQRGEARITAQGKSIRLKSGQGTRVKKNSPPEPPMLLPSPPAWEDSKAHELHVAHTATGKLQVAGKLQWAQPLPDSSQPTSSQPPSSLGRHRIEVAKDSQFLFPLFEKTTDQLEFPLAELPPGTSYVRMRTLNEAGLISSPSPAKRLDILKIDAADSSATQTPDTPGAPDTPGTPDTPGAASTTQKMTGQAPFNLTVPEDILVLVNGNLQAAPVVIQHPGKYLVEFKTLDGQQSVHTEVEAVPPKFSSDIRLSETESPELWVRFETAIPEDAILTAQGLEGTNVGPLTREDELTFKAPVSGHPPYQIHVLWGDYLLDNLRQDTSPPSAQPSLSLLDEPVFPQHVQRTPILRERRLGSLVLPTTYLPQSLRLNAALDLDFSKNRDTVARLAARVDGPFKKGTYFANLTLVNTIGKTDSFVYPEIAVGAQMQFPLTKPLVEPPTKQWTAGFAADFSGNLNAYRLKQETLLRLRTLGVFGFQGEAFSVSTSQGFAIEYANSLRVAWIGSISASWHIWPKFLLAAQLDGQKTASRGFASAAAMGFRLLIGPVELGLTGHAGLTSEGRSQWGDYGVSLSLGIR